MAFAKEELSKAIAYREDKLGRTAMAIIQQRYGPTMIDVKISIRGTSKCKEGCNFTVIQMVLSLTQPCEEGWLNEYGRQIRLRQPGKSIQNRSCRSRMILDRDRRINKLL